HVQHSFAHRSPPRRPYSNVKSMVLVAQFGATAVGGTRQEEKATAARCPAALHAASHARPGELRAAAHAPPGHFHAASYAAPSRPSGPQPVTALAVALWSPHLFATIEVRREPQSITRPHQ